MAPRVICPSIPMFHNPAAKVTSSPEVARTRGTQATRTSVIFLTEPTDPMTIWR